MFALLYLGCLYIWYGGTLLNYMKSVWGQIVPEDATPPGQKDDAATPLGHKDEAATPSDSAYGSEGERGFGKIRGQTLLLLSSSTAGGTFTDSYRQVRGDDNISISSPGGSVSSVGSLNAHTKAFHTTFPRSTRQQWFLSKEDRDILKRRTVKSRLTPMGLLSSFISDLDLVSDWVFLKLVLIDFPSYLQTAGLVFAVFGTIMWALSTTEFAMLSMLRVMWRGSPASRLEHVGLGWQLLANVFLEDFPQFVITVATKPNSIPGALNIVMSTFSLASKIIKGLSSRRAPSLATQFHMIDADPFVTRHLFQLRDEAKKKAGKAEKLVYWTWIYRCSEGEKKAAAVFHVLQLDPTFVNGDLDYMKVDLVLGGRLCITDCGLTGHIPSHVGAMAALRILILRDNDLNGAIPKELSTLSMLKELDLSKNKLEGEIPEDLSSLGSLEILNLSSNKLTGAIPSALGGIPVLEQLIVHNNKLSGEIPVELSDLDALRELDLSNNELTGSLPYELSFLSALEILSVRDNMLSGPIPYELGNLQKLKSFVVADNMFSDAERTDEELKLKLHPDCETDFLPQRREKHGESEEDIEEEYGYLA